MTEAEWLRCQDPTPMLQFLGPSGRLTDRKARLFAVACRYRIWHLIAREEDARCPQAVQAAERYADGRASREELTALTAYPRAGLYAADAAFETAEYVPMTAAGADRIAAEAEAEWQSGLAYQAAFPHGYTPDSGRGEELVRVTSEAFGRALPVAERAQAALLRDLFGLLLFRPVTVTPSVLTWNDGIIPKLARSAYDNRHLPEGTLDRARLAVLADAVEESGYSDAELLGHLRGPGPHVRGCYAVDVILGRT